MIVERIRPRRLADRLMRRKPRVLALFSYRYDAHLVPDLVENIAPLVDGWVSFDDRRATQAFSEPARRSALIGRARELGAAWVLAVDPDERFETATAGHMAEMTAVEGKVVWGFHLREMYAPDAYRIDGIWGKKAQWRLFPLLEGQVFPHAVAHQPWHPTTPRYDLRHSGLDLYHLKMITAERRARGGTSIGCSTPATSCSRSATTISPTRPAPSSRRFRRGAATGRPMPTMPASGWRRPPPFPRPEPRTRRPHSCVP